MLLFGVGAAASASNSNTTLGRIGLGYLYTDFKPQVSWTLPGMDALGGNFGAKIGLFDPDDVHADTTDFSATDTSSPRVEAQITYAGGIGDLGINLWVDGTYQNTGRSEAEAAARTTVQDADGTADITVDRDTDVDSAGVAFGTKLSYQGFALVASGFYANGLGIRGQHSVGSGAGATGALDDVGTQRNSYGGYLQGTYDFGQGTSAGYSYGGNCLVRTGNDIQTRGVMNCQTMHSGMIWHNVTDNFRLVAEGGYTEKTWYLADSDQEDSFGGVGAFFFW
jgi:hypothetical protein